MSVFQRLLRCLSGSNIIILNSVENPVRLNQGLHKDFIFLSLYSQLLFGKWNHEGRNERQRKIKPQCGDRSSGRAVGIPSDLWKHKNKHPPGVWIRGQILEWKQSFGRCCCTFPVSFVLLGRWMWVCVCVLCELCTGSYPVHKGIGTDHTVTLILLTLTTSNTGSTKHTHNKPAHPGAGFPASGSNAGWSEAELTDSDRK